MNKPTIFLRVGDPRIAEWLCSNPVGNPAASMDRVVLVDLKGGVRVWPIVDGARRQA